MQIDTFKKELREEKSESLPENIENYYYNNGGHYQISFCINPKEFKPVSEQIRINALSFFLLCKKLSISTCNMKCNIKNDTRNFDG